MAVAILYQDDIKEYDFGSGHPFNGDRYPKFMKFLQSRLPPNGRYDILKVSPASETELLKICDQDYVDFSREYYLAAAAGWIGYYENFTRYHSTDNKPIGTPGNVEKAARIIIGQARTACDLIQDSQYRKVISIGGGMHHAKRRFGKGSVCITTWLLPHCI